MLSVLETLVDRVVALDTAMFWLCVLLWVMLSACAGGIAQGKGHAGGGYFLLSLLLSPMVGLLAAFILNDTRAERIAALEALVAPNAGASGRAEPVANLAKDKRVPAPHILGFVVVSMLIVGGVFLFGVRLG